MLIHLVLCLLAATFAIPGLAWEEEAAPAIWPANCVLWTLRPRPGRTILDLVHHSQGHGTLGLPTGYVGARHVAGPDGVNGSALAFSGFNKGGAHLNGPGGLVLGAEWGISLWLETSHMESANTILCGEGPGSRFELQIHKGAVWLQVGGPMRHVVRESYFKFPGSKPWTPHVTGANVPRGGWHLIALAMVGGKLLVDVDNGHSRGQVEARHLSTVFGQLLGAGGSGHFWGYGTRTGFTGAMSRLKVCTHASVNPPAQLAAKRAAWASFANYLARVRANNQDWLRAVKGRRVLLIGNSARIMAAKVQLGQTIDGFDEVVRFNSNPVKGYEAYVGKKRTFDVANDFRDVCGCMKGECCSKQKQALFWNQIATSQEKPGNILMFNDAGFPSEDWMRAGSRGHGVHVVTADGPHMCGLFLYPWLEASGIGARLPIYISCRTGMRVIGIFLVNDVHFTVAGFDTEEKEYLSYSGHALTKHDRPGGAYPQEQMFMSELFRMNVFEDIEKLVM